MSRGFVKESDQEEAPFVAPRAALPEGAINYVTPRGLRLLHGERETLEADRAAIADATTPEGRRTMGILAAKLIQLNDRIASARLVEPEDVNTDEVRFGARVDYLQGQLSPKPVPGVPPRLGRAPKPTHVYIVGVDEASIREQRVSYLSPLARALLGKRAGESVELRIGPRTDELTVTAIGYGQASD